jgi:hypothetical protein
MVLLQMAWLQMGVKMATTMVGSFFSYIFVGFSSPKEGFLVPSPDCFFLHSHEDHQ